MTRIVTSLSPNAERDDVRLAASLLFQPWRWQKGHAVTDLEQALSAFFNAQTITFESGRSALTAVIKAFGFPEHSEIILQAFTCVAVPNSIRWANCKPIYIDVNPNTYTLDITALEKKITPRTKAILVQHTFGLPADMDSLLACAKKHDLKIIEDCAHSFSSRWNGQLLGTFGDAAIFSFGRDKSLSSVFGGIAMTRDQSLAHTLRNLQKHAPIPSRWWIVQQLLHPLVLASALTIYDKGSLGKIWLEVAKRLKIISKAVETSERLGKRPSWSGKRLANALAILALHQWKKRERFDAHRRKLTQLYTKKLNSTHITLPSWPSHVEPALLRYPIQSRHRDHILKVASQSRIQLGDWYTSPLAPNGVDVQTVGYDPGTTPNAVILAHTTLNLPTHTHITEADAERIIDIVNKTSLASNL